MRVGQVGLRQVDLGNYVQTSSTTGLVVITQMQPISVLFSVPEDNLPDIIQRVRSGATLSVEAYDRANVRLLALTWAGYLIGAMIGAWFATRGRLYKWVVIDLTIIELICFFGARP